MPVQYRVSRKDLQKGTVDELREHPWASETRARRIARDHIQRYGPGYYAAEPITKQAIKSLNKGMNVKPIRKRPVRRYNPLTDGLPDRRLF